MGAHVGAGVPAAEAARLVLEEGEPVPAPAAADFATEATALQRALESFDDAGSQEALDSLLASFSFEMVARDVLLPYCGYLGERWERGRGLGCSGALRERRAAGSPARHGEGLGSWDGSAGAARLCAGRDARSGADSLGLALRAQGWRITYLGPDTPLDTLQAAVADLEPDAVVVAALDADRLGARREQAERVGGHLSRPFLAGAGATGGLTAAVGAQPLRGDPVSAAAELASARPRVSPTG